MELREFLLLTHLATGASPTVAHNVMVAIADGAPAVDQTLVDAAPARSRARLLRWLNEPMHRAQWQALCAHTQYMTIVDSDYPERLRMIEQPPLVLFYAGHPELLHMSSVGIVGARSGGEYSEQALAQLLPALSPNVAIISGLAKGADGIAHRAALTTGLPPVGVIATGIDRFYPAQNRHLQSAVAQHGLLLSEYPPGTSSMPYRFIARNRIIAGLSHVLLVTEARHKSGSLITATMAAENGRTVCVLPNRIDAPLGVGPNELIQQGATLARQAADISTELRYFD